MNNGCLQPGTTVLRKEEYNVAEAEMPLSLLSSLSGGDILDHTIWARFIFKTRNPDYTTFQSSSKTIHSVRQHFDLVRFKIKSLEF